LNALRNKYEKFKNEKQKRKEMEKQMLEKKHEDSMEIIALAE
jgi:hypothetical protein